ncbi:MAG TPA: hypothetical protein VLI07_08880 [Candidatus Binatus sp.]|nr:hypothetical protein [Candidatus Binatus sp.]
MSKSLSVTARLVLALVLVPVVLGCRPDPSTPRGTAERFLDAHFVHIDLPAALEFTSGLARHKVEDEIRLVAGQTIDETTRKPSVHYRLLEERPDGEQAVSFLYRGSIAVEDAESFERRWLVTVRRDEGAWRVTNYQEFGG